MSWVIFLSFSWKELRNKTVSMKIWICLFLYSVGATYIHCNWPVFALPLFCFLLAREFRAAINLFIIIVNAILAGACLTGHPLIFLKQTALHG